MNKADNFCVSLYLYLKDKKVLTENEILAIKDKLIPILDEIKEIVDTIRLINA